MFQVDPRFGIRASPQPRRKFGHGGLVEMFKAGFPRLFMRDSSLGPLPTQTDADILSSQQELMRRLALAQGRKSTVVTGGLANNPTISRMGLMGM